MQLPRKLLCCVTEVLSTKDTWCFAPNVLGGSPQLAPLPSGTSCNPEIARPLRKLTLLHQESHFTPSSHEQRTATRAELGASKPIAVGMLLLPARPAAAAPRRDSQQLPKKSVDLDTTESAAAAAAAGHLVVYGPDTCALQEQEQDGGVRVPPLTRPSRSQLR